MATLIATGAAITVGGVNYIAYKECKKKKKTYSHYMAYKKKKSGLFIGNGLSKKNAIKRLKKFDTWSTTKRNAQIIAKQASPIRKSVGAEIDKSGKRKHYHYHPAKSKEQGKYIRMETHAFYGAPR